MNKGSDFNLEFQAMSRAELFQKYKIKVENAKTMKKSKGSISKQKSLTTGSAVQEVRSTQIQHKKQDQRKQSLATRSVIQRKDPTQVLNQKDHVKSTSIVQPESSKKIDLKRRTTMKNQVQESMEKQAASKKQKTTPKCPSLSLDDYIKRNKQQLEVEESEDESSQQELEEDINYENDGEETNDNLMEGEPSKRKRGKTLCLKIHARSLDDRQEITLNEEGEPIGPNQKAVSEFSNFLGTIARSADLCPLIYTNWKAIPKKEENIWDYVNKKYIVPEKGKKAVYAIISDAWRRYKCMVKKNHFSKYKNLRERLKSRPENIPEAHFRELMDYWRLETIKEISHQNAKNIAQQKWRHRAGPISFAVKGKDWYPISIARASKEDGEPPTQAEMFIETRQSKKGKQLDQETNNVIIKLQDLIVNTSQPSTEVFQSVFGKEKTGRVRCYGRITTPSLLKRNKEIAEIKKMHANEVKHLTDKVQEMEAKHEEMEAKHKEMEAKHSKEMAAMELKFQLLLRAMLTQNNSGLDVEALAALFSTPADANSANNHELNPDDMDEDQMLDNLEEEEYEDIL